MSNFKKLKSELKDLYAIRNVNRVVYFHCDHWEPWRSQPGQSIYCQQNVDGVGMYVDACNKIDFARRQTLFYKPNVSHGVLAKGIVEPAGSQKVHADDRIFFADKTAAQTEFAKAALHHVVAGSDHELQIHIHHENFTFNHSHKAPISQEYFGTADSRLHEDERFSLAVKLWLQTLRDESGLPIDKWFFVHGLWALNGSDANVCHLVREIEIMMRHGCLGDFTFPAGRVHVNPRLEVPYFAKPVAKPKGYDLQECEPEFAYGNGAAVAAGSGHTRRSLPR